MKRVTINMWVGEEIERLPHAVMTHAPRPDDLDFVAIISGDWNGQDYINLSAPYIVEIVEVDHATRIAFGYHA